MATVYSKSPDVVFRKIADEFVLVPIRKNVADLESIYALNEVGGRIWELIDGKRTTDEIHKIIAEEFDVVPDEAEEDVKNFVKSLSGTGSIKES